MCLGEDSRFGIGDSSQTFKMCALHPSGEWNIFFGSAISSLGF